MKTIYSNQEFDLSLSFQVIESAQIFAKFENYIGKLPSSSCRTRLKTTFLINKLA
jgi:hypothetical protein